MDDLTSLTSVAVYGFITTNFPHGVTHGLQSGCAECVGEVATLDFWDRLAEEVAMRESENMILDTVPLEDMAAC